MMGIAIIGTADVAETLEKLSNAAKKKLGTDALVEALTPMIDAARARASDSVDTGNLKASIGFRVKAYKNGKILGYVGPRNGFKVVDRHGKTRIATKYSHLVEFGHAKKGGGTVAAEPFLRPAFAATSQQCAATLGAVLGRKIEIEATRLSRRKRRKK